MTKLAKIMQDEFVISKKAIECNTFSSVIDALSNTGISINDYIDDETVFEQGIDGKLTLIRGKIKHNSLLIDNFTEKLESNYRLSLYDDVKICEYCGNHNKSENQQCYSCGANLKI